MPLFRIFKPDSAFSRLVTYACIAKNIMNFSPPLNVYYISPRQGKPPCQMDTNVKSDLY